MERWRTLAPAGTRIPVGDLARCLRRVPIPFQSGSLEDEFARRMGAGFAVTASSGRALMAMALEVLSTLRPEAREVVIPGYTCPSVAGSVVAAGLQLRPVDVDPQTLDYLEPSLEAATSGDTLAIISGNLFGLPNDLPRLEAFARSREIYLIDDAAQALGAAVDGRPVGTFGDVGLFSLDKGKVITTMEGGVVVGRGSEIGALLREKVESLPNPGGGQQAILLLKLVAYVALLRPGLYTLPDRLLPLGRTLWDPDPRRTRYPQRMAPLALCLLERVETLNKERRLVRKRLLESIAAAGTRVGLSPVRPGAEGEVEVAPIRLPLLTRDREHRDRVLGALAVAGLGASTMYPRAIVDIPEARPHLVRDVGDTPNARGVAETLLTLPTHGWVQPADLQEIVRRIHSIAPA